VLTGKQKENIPYIVERLPEMPGLVYDALKKVVENEGQEKQLFMNLSQCKISDPGAEEIVMHDMEGHDYFCSSCNCHMQTSDKHIYKCPKCGLVYRG